MFKTIKRENINGIDKKIDFEIVHEVGNSLINAIIMVKEINTRFKNIL